MIKLVNFYDHPSNNTYKVFQFTRKEMADFFEAELLKAKIPYEKHAEEENERMFFYYGIKKTYFKQTSKINYLTWAKHREPFISNSYAKYILLILTFGMLMIAVIGYFISGQ